MADKLIVTKKDHENPFQMPPDSELYTLKAREKSEKLKEKKDSYSLPIHKKSTKAVELKSYHTTLRKVRELGLEEEKVGSFNIVTPGELDPDFVLSVTKERRSEKESIAEYLAKKREIFLIEYSLGVKRKEISKLQEIAEMEEAHVKLEEENLEKNDEAFNKFVKESDQLTMESVKEAEKQTKAKLEKITELKRLQAQVVGIQSEISKLEELLGEYKLYEEFLDNLSPKEWQEKKNKRKNFKTEISTLSSHKYNAHTFSSISSDSGFSAGEEENINEDEPHLYFTAPEQVLKVLHDIEEQNLSLIQHSQETQKNLEEMEEICRKTQVKMSKETETLIDQVKVLETAIKWEEEKATELEMMAKYDSSTVWPVSPYSSIYLMYPVYLCAVPHSRCIIYYVMPCSVRHFLNIAGIIVPNAMVTAAFNSSLVL
ncbi:cilia- and flagella-associated protein 100-like isoform X2 [Tachypleus tridentatus]|uniref:cilia- and flagella-associated protein 100-like isoform X2 n=1 Tax=Tachypleus tridentatus TaxID=6853 RepID=UPI003FD303F7